MFGSHPKFCIMFVTKEFFVTYNKECTNKFAQSQYAETHCWVLKKLVCNQHISQSKVYEMLVW